MPLLCVGIDHKTAPLAIRELAVMDETRAGLARDQLLDGGPAEELVILSTCNRVELYLFAGDAVACNASIRAFFSSIDPHLDAYLVRRDEMDVAEHLFRIACGLESQTLGEAQVSGQVREALLDAQQSGSAGTNLNALFRAAIACMRRARADTALGRINPSIASEAIAMATSELQGLEGKGALLVGGGEIVRLAAAELRSKGIARLFIANRTHSVADEIAALHDAKSIGIRDIDEVVGSIDLLISATAARDHVLTTSLFAAIDRPPGRPLIMYDLAFPRDVEPEVAALPSVRLHDLDSVLPVTATQHWQDDIQRMEAIIAAELQEFRSWVLVRRVVPVIANLRSHVEAVSAQELKRVEPQLQGLNERERQAVESLTNRLVDKMFHHLVTRLRLAAQTDPQLVEAAEFFFLHGEGGLFPHAVESESVPDEAEKL